MSIDFDQERWNRIRRDYSAWWAGQLDRPLLQVIFSGCDPERDAPELPSHSFASFYDLSIPAEAIVDRWDYDLSCQKYAGDSFPFVFPNFGPGVIAAFLGASLENGQDTVWFHPVDELDIADLHLAYRSDSVWLKRVKNLCRAALNRWSGQVQLTMTDLGGNLDILASFRTTQKLLTDLYDHPDQVKRLLGEIHSLWFEFYEDIDSVLRCGNPGYADWACIFSTGKSYMLQCDFSYMISPDMFEEFVKPELHQTCRRLENCFYHLDGPGQLGHLDTLLSMNDLKGIQWVPGARQPSPLEWIEVYKRIRAAGKLVQLHKVADFDVFDAVVDKLGSPKGLIARINAHISMETKVLKRLEQYAPA